VDLVVCVLYIELRFLSVRVIVLDLLLDVLHDVDVLALRLRERYEPSGVKVQALPYVLN
jgi:hypothetical protein